MDNQISTGAQAVTLLPVTTDADPVAPVHVAGHRAGAGGQSPHHPRLGRSRLVGACDGQQVRRPSALVPTERVYAREGVDREPSTPSGHGSGRAKGRKPTGRTSPGSCKPMATLASIRCTPAAASAKLHVGLTRGESTSTCTSIPDRHRRSMRCSAALSCARSRRPSAASRPMGDSDRAASMQLPSSWRRSNGWTRHWRRPRRSRPWARRSVHGHTVVALARYVDDGHTEIDASAAERGLRCVALGRNNFLVRRFRHWRQARRRDVQPHRRGQTNDLNPPPACDMSLSASPITR